MRRWGRNYTYMDMFSKYLYIVVFSLNLTQAQKETP